MANKKKRILANKISKSSNLSGIKAEINVLTTLIKSLPVNDDDHKHNDGKHKVNIGIVVYQNFDD